MPISAQDFRRSVGYYDARSNEGITDNITQEKLNKISALQTGKIPQRFGFLTMLVLLGVVSNTFWQRNTRDLHAVSSNNYGKGKGNDNVTIYQSDGETQGIYKYDAMAHLNFVSPFSSMPSVLSERQLQDIPDTISLRQIGGKVGDFLCLRFNELFNVLHRYDPLVFSVAEAAIARRITTTPAPEDSVVIVKNDYTCIEERANLSVTDILSKIADTLSFPVTNMAVESQIVSYYRKNGVCPTRSEMSVIRQISFSVDTIISFLTSLRPEYGALIIMQNLVAPVMRMTLEELGKKNVPFEDILKLNLNLLGYSRSMIDLSFVKKHGVQGDELIVPKLMKFGERDIYISINGEMWRLSKENGHLYATRNHISYRTSYDPDAEVWLLHEEKVSDNEGDDFFNQTCDTRSRRGISLGSLCSHSVQSDLSHQEASNILDAAPHTTDRKRRAEQAIIDKLDIGLTPDSTLVDKIIFFDSWVVYRVRVEDKVNSRIYHAVEMNKKLVPIKATAIYNNHVSCEIYDMNNIGEKYRVEFHNNKWKFEPPTSFYVSNELKNAIYYSADFEKVIDPLQLTMLSAPGSHYLQVDKHGHAYLRVDEMYVRVNKHDDELYITSKNEGRLYIAQKDNQYHVTHASFDWGKLELSHEAIKLDMALNSAKGWSNNQLRLLNYHWNIVHTNVKSYNYYLDKGLGSHIDVMLRMKYNPNGFNIFFEPPDIQWNEVIRFKDNDNVWTFSADMYVHNRHSQTFYPWNNRYLAAYHYAKKSVKNRYEEPVRIYNKDMEPLASTSFPHASSAKEQVELVKNYLKDNGGFLDITISDFPKVFVEGEHTYKERFLNINVGFLDKKLFSVSQGIIAHGKHRSRVFVTSSPDVRLVHEPVNSLPPESVSRKRI